MRRRPDDWQDRHRPRPIADALRELLKVTGLEKDVARAGVLQAWPALVGPQIAAVTVPRLMAEDGTLVVGVRTHGWMSELSMMERQLVAKLCAAGGPTPVKRIRWELLR
jgi:predicted nucleic acid-binding Zn ribbon protein